jgi:rare lipoprotein A
MQSRRQQGYGQSSRGPMCQGSARESDVRITAKRLRPGRVLVLETLVGLLLIGLLSCAKESTHTLRGLASWYGERHHGGLTASGERFDMYALTAAHRTLPMGTRLRVTNLTNGRSVVVIVNDRGPWIRARIIDLSYAAAHRIGLINAGTAPIQLEVLD